MKVLLFTHEADIDGLGGVVLSKLAFGEVTAELSSNRNVNQKFFDYWQKGKLEQFDKIFFTDIALSKENIEKVEKERDLKDKILIFDHHIAQKDIANQYDWVKIVVEDEKGKCCGTSLFYEYLLRENYLQNSVALQQFVENTRQYDTWEWKTIYDNKMAEDMTILLYQIGRTDYINTMYQKILGDPQEFKFTLKEKELIQTEQRRINQYVSDKIEQMVIQKIEGYRAGVIFAERYANFIIEELRQRKAPIDYAIFIDLGKNSVQYRSMGEVETWKIAMKYGGKGNRLTGGNRIVREKVEKIINVVFPEQ